MNARMHRLVRLWLWTGMSPAILSWSSQLTKPRQIALLLLVGPKLVDGVHYKGGLHACSRTIARVYSAVLISVMNI